MCKSDALLGLSSTRTSASPGAKGGVGISASFNTLFGSPVSRKINAFINTSWVFRRRLIPAGDATERMGLYRLPDQEMSPNCIELNSTRPQQSLTFATVRA